jgi:hypothetical protein
MMTAPNLVSAARVHTGPWEAFPRLAGASRRLRRTLLAGSGSFVRLYYLLDARGRRLGVIMAPTQRPASGRCAPTVYLRRT